MTNPHSVFRATTGYSYVVRSGTLYSINVETYSETLIKVLSTNDKLTYVEVNGSVFASNGTDSLRIDGETVRPAALAAPSAPAVSSGAGTLPVGRYQIALSYSNSTTGEEGVLSTPKNFTLSAAGSIVVTLPTSMQGATHVNVYASEVNGSMGYLQATVALGTSSYTVGTVLKGREWKLRYEAPLPAGRLFMSNGRLCSIKGKTVYIGLPYRHGYYVPTEGYVTFPVDVGIAVENQNGTYISADNTYWIPGDLGNVQDKLDTVLPYGAVSGTEFSFPDKSVVGWFGEKGVVIATQEGQVTALMAENIDVTPPQSGVSVVFESDGFRRVVSCNWCINIENGAATSYSSWDITSVSGGYATKADGIYKLDQSESVDAEIDFGKGSFEVENMKRVPTVYIGCSSDDRMILEVSTPNAEIFSYESRSSDDDLMIQRFDLGKGLRANWFNFKLKNQGGSDFDLASMSLVPAISTRRI